jgi:non-ribosomal peptide synthetase-like protein
MSMVRALPRVRELVNDENIPASIFFSHPSVRALAAELDRIAETTAETRASIRVCEDEQQTASVAPAKPTARPAPSYCTYWIQGLLIVFDMFLGSIAQVVDTIFTLILLGNINPWLLAIGQTFASMVLSNIFFIIALVLKWTLLGRMRAGVHPLWGSYYLKWWIVHGITKDASSGLLALIIGADLGVQWEDRLFGITIGRNCVLNSTIDGFDLCTIGNNVVTNSGTTLTTYFIRDGYIHFGPVTLEEGCVVGFNSIISPWCTVGEDSEVEHMTLLQFGQVVPPNSVVYGNPAVLSAEPPQPVIEATLQELLPPGADEHLPLQDRHVLYKDFWTWRVLISMFCVSWADDLFGLVLTWLETLLLMEVKARSGLAFVFLVRPLLEIVFDLVTSIIYAALSLPILWNLSPGTIEPGSNSMILYFIYCSYTDAAQGGLVSFKGTVIEQYVGGLINGYVGQDVESTTDMGEGVAAWLSINDGAFLTDDVVVATAEYGRGGTLHLQRTTVGEDTFVGNNSVVDPGIHTGSGTFIAMMSRVRTTAKNKTIPDGFAWLGNPATIMPNRRQSEVTDGSDKQRPDDWYFYLTRWLAEIFGIWKGLVEDNVWNMVSIAVLLQFGESNLQQADSATILKVIAALALCSYVVDVLELVLMLILKWTLLGRIRPQENGLWSLFMQLKALGGSNGEGSPLVEMALGTPFLVWWFRALGATIGNNVWLNTIWISEPDLCNIGDNVCLDTHSEVQTHLFEDRVQRLDYATVGDGVTVHPMAVVLMGSNIANNAEIMGLSVPLPYENVPGPSEGCTGSWTGNPLSTTHRFCCVGTSSYCEPDSIAARLRSENPGLAAIPTSAEVEAIRAGMPQDALPDGEQDPLSDDDDAPTTGNVEENPHIEDASVPLDSESVPLIEWLVNSCTGNVNLELGRFCARATLCCYERTVPFCCFEAESEMADQEAEETRRLLDSMRAPSDPTSISGPKFQRRRDPGI